MISEILDTLGVSLRFVRASVADLSEEEMVEQPAGAPNHAMWTVGHLVHSCQGMAAELGAATWLPEEWESLFGFGSEPRREASCYPCKNEMLTLLTVSADRLGDALRAMTEVELAQSLPDDDFPTMGHLLVQVLIAHTAYHAGQLTAWRRSTGRPPVGVFV